MADKTHIEWTDATWNPTVGCTKVSPGCDNCYAETFVNRFAGSKGFPLPFDRLLLRGDRFLNLPFTLRRPRRIFVNSLSDLFHADVPDSFIAEVFAVMALNPRHTFQLLTKRHARMRSLLSDEDFRSQVSMAIADQAFHDRRDDTHLAEAMPDWWPLANVWLGVSVEDQHWADIRIPALLATPAAIRWVSAEPLLGPLCLCDYLWAGDRSGVRLDWVVTGGESGPGARPMHPQWAIDVAHDCEDNGVAFLHKQNGAYLPDQAGEQRAVDTDGREYPGRFRRVGKTAAGRELAGRIHDGYPLTQVGAR